MAAGNDDKPAAGAKAEAEPAPTPSAGSSGAQEGSSPEKKKAKKKKRAPIVYRWIGQGETQSDGTVTYGKLEMRVGGHAALVRVGDCALLCSGDVEEDQLYEDTDAAVAAVADSKGGDDGDVYGAKDANRREEEDHYGPLDYDVAVNKLDPFVARIEKMWEEPPDAGGAAAAKKRSRAQEVLVNYDERRSRMKIRARWFYKKEDIEGLMSNFVGVSRSDLLETMTARELILGDQADDNEISTILGKCRVVRRRPLATGEDGKVVRPVDDTPTGAFACRYSLTLQPPARAGAAGTVNFSPYDGVDEGIDGGDETGSSVGGSPQLEAGAPDQPSSKRRRVDNVDDDEGSRSSSARQQQSAADAASDAGSRRRGSGRTGTSEGEATSGKNDSNSSSTSSSDDEDASDVGSAGKSDDAKRAPTSEGSQLHGSIMVGPGHQAVVPPLDREQALRSRDAKLIWEPGSISEENVDGYLEKAASILKAHMETKGMDIAETPLYDFLERDDTDAAAKTEGSKDPTDSGDVAPRKRKPRVVFRECDVDSLLAHLHDCSYDVQKALDGVSKTPEAYLTIWTKREKELFNSGFRRYYGGLRTISKGIGKSKPFKDVVDYHYRFKIPEQFCKYKDKKREQARRIMESVEKQRLHAAMVEDGEDVSGIKSISGGPVTPSGGKKTRNLAKTGGGSPHSIGKAEKRRILARELLSVIRDTIGNDDYIRICRLLKSHYNRSSKTSIPNLKERASDLLGDHPELLDRFIEFLPKKHRN